MRLLLVAALAHTLQHGVARARRAAQIVQPAPWPIRARDRRQLARAGDTRERLGVGSPGRTLCGGKRAQWHAGCSWLCPWQRMRGTAAALAPALECDHHFDRCERNTRQERLGVDGGRARARRHANGESRGAPSGSGATVAAGGQKEMQ